MENILELKLPYRRPYHWDALIGFLLLRAAPGVEAAGEHCYRRTVRCGDRAGIIEVRCLPREPHLLLRIPGDLAPHSDEIAAGVGRLFDLQVSPREVAGRLGSDPQLARLVRAFPGLRLPGAWNGFEIAVRAILGQQVSVKSATTLLGRVLKVYGDPLETGDPELFRLFPSPERLACAPLEEHGVIPRRSGAIRFLAQEVAQGRLSFQSRAGLDDTISRLTALLGVGPWTAHYIAMRACGEADAFPSGDLILRRAAAPGNSPVTERELLRKAEAWRPWRAYAAVYLWTQYGNGGG